MVGRVTGLIIRTTFCDCIINVILLIAVSVVNVKYYHFGFNVKELSLDDIFIHYLRSIQHTVSCYLYYMLLVSVVAIPNFLEQYTSLGIVQTIILKKYQFLN